MAAMVEKEIFGMEELMKEATPSQTGKSINIAGRWQQFLLYQYRDEDRSQRGL
jgi:hypothetical protein